MIYGLVGTLLLAYIIIVIALNNECCCIREHGSLIVVAISVKTVNVVFLPQFAIYFVLFGEIRLEVNQNGYGIAWNSPATYLYIKTLFGCCCAPRLKKCGVFLKIRALFLAPTIGTDENQIVAKLLFKGLCTGGKNCINTTYLVANVPTRLKNIVRK